MTDNINDNIYGFIKEDILSFYELRRYLRKGNTINKDYIYGDISDIAIIKDKIYNQILIYESYARRIYVRKFIEILNEYKNVEEIKATLAIAILDYYGIKPNYKRPIDALGVGLMNDSFKLSYYNLDNLEFDLEEECDLFFKAYFDRVTNTIAFLNEINSDFVPEYKFSDRTELINSKKVFIVHGHSEGLKYDVARLIEKFGLTSIILHEQNNLGNTIIEKIENNSDVKYAIVLLTDDDLGRGKSEIDLKPRARQNVIAELGYFVGLLGRKNVVCIINNDLIEIPSDFSGVLYLNSNKDWKLQLAKELKGVGFDINLEVLLE